MNHKNAHLLYFGGMILGIIICFLSAAIEFDFGLYIGAAVVIGLVFLAQHFYVCPHCGDKLHLKSPKPGYCPHCGKKIEW